MKNRIEILKNDNWIDLQLYNNAKVKYNSVINKIGETRTREISHSNTFKIPVVHKNIDALGLNRFNPNIISSSLNTKYNAKYFIGDKLTQVGFIVINNMDEGDINLNFIDEALSLTSLWSDITFKQLLNSNTLSIPSDYEAAIAEMKNYDMQKNVVIPSLSEVGTRGYNLSLFPNNLNNIGDTFQSNVSNVRPDNGFNVYQSRPIFNVRALFDLACESFGYTPIYDDSVDWAKVQKTYMVKGGLDDDGLKDSGLVENTYTKGSINWFVIEVVTLQYFRMYFKFEYDLFSPQPEVTSVSNTIYDAWGNPLLLFKPSGSTLEGSITWKAILNGNGASSHSKNVIITSMWLDSGGAEVIKNHSLGSASPIIDNSSGVNLEWSLDKAHLQTPPSGGVTLLGVFCGLEITGQYQYWEPGGTNYSLSNVEVIEQELPSDTISYDEQGQFLGEDIDLVYSAPEKSLKNLLSAYMQKDGILMNIDNKKKEVLFFSYAMYSRVISGNERPLYYYSNWSKYLLKNSFPKYNTNYGNSYGRINNIGLQEPFSGNTFRYEFENFGEDSKYKERSDDHNKLFKDIVGALAIGNSIAPYTEFQCDGLSLVYHDGFISGLNQTRYDDTTQGVIIDLPKIVNVNGLDLPIGTRAWYEVIDNSVRIEAKFLLPLQVIIDLKLFEPVYIEHLGGFYIVEEVSEYTNPQTPVTVKLIKLRI